ncbi:carbamoyltransferase C-terminal domain-containing protein [Streptomyces sp. TRM76323]|uniref:Carbamoyltransferase C-terminal domain-containing protein n=1 Tax=Streptomyces tamarix TaxID=3078565 RepID=A0ABU3QV32_9ACTN|nr:carbamoyltransferase C-terminal domain-containing protein [Streptomyces tamarix]MDT9686413.1 carbamoyltransferase C-terminal domain-containing protein [Streptomyces tamarix]
MLLPDGGIVALASERVGERRKHSWDPRPAYHHLRSLPAYQPYFGGPGDQFVDNADGLHVDDHHRNHAASAFHGSGFEQAAVLVVDGQGYCGDRLVTTSIWAGTAAGLHLVEEQADPGGVFAARSIGHFYSAVGALAGMGRLHDEGKTMALAAYGGPSRFLDRLRVFAGTEEDGGYRIDPRFTTTVLANTLGRKYYGWSAPTPEDQALWDDLVAARARPPMTGCFDQDDMDIAYAGQVILEEIVLGLARRAHRLTGSTRLCLAGGVALNCVANGRVAGDGPFEELFVVCAPGDDGQAVGKLFLDVKRRALPVDTTMHTAYYGPEYSAGQIELAVREVGASVVCVRMDDSDLLPEVATRLSNGEVIGWWQGRSELGPRALGHRSILADPRRPWMRDHINSSVKEREWFRPLAPMTVEERAGEFFELDQPSPFMARAVKVRPGARALIPAVTHVDGTARVQTLRRSQDPRCYELLERFDERAGVPILLNTSFNRRDEPLVETPSDACRAFLDMNLDALVLEDRLLVKQGAR